MCPQIYKRVDQEGRTVKSQFKYTFYSKYYKKMYYNYFCTNTKNRIKLVNIHRFSNRGCGVLLTLLDYSVPVTPGHFLHLFAASIPLIYWIWVMCRVYHTCRLHVMQYTTLAEVQVILHLILTSSSLAQHLTEVTNYLRWLHAGQLDFLQGWKLPPAQQSFKFLLNTKIFYKYNFFENCITNICSNCHEIYQCRLSVTSF